ncbi:homoserine O-acetyltransferase [Steroidobacter denitrificans]|uniref:Homoserine O-acetyltransferase n=1 Tax=Steroidobacter denitrificans TaxID=465721 RepID=A0A127FBS5_STEDE|nr:homoserine O-succinyltransferase [Steroidobacter denitrificans]AMN47060.1 homoserine O-acetyltransferase [Steroidobacter denitrificans]
MSLVNQKEGEYAPVPVREGILKLSAPLTLTFGGRLDTVSVAWRVSGNPQAPLVAALGGISAGRAVADVDKTQKGWWGGIIGVGKALDLNQYQVLGIDFLGGSGTTTGPRPGQVDFPSISTTDQAEILRQVLAHVRQSAIPGKGASTGRIHPLAAIIGASYGGMVALAFAQRWPQLVERIVVISAADQPHPLSTAWRSVERAVVRYATARGDGPEGLRLARALAMTTYRSAREFADRFDQPAVRIDGRYQFPVESYLLARGDAYAANYIPEAFVCLSESIDLHRIDASQVRVSTTLVGIVEDQLVPIADMRRLQQRLGGPVRLVELSSLYGHDAFLKETDALRQVFAAALNDNAVALNDNDGES